MSDYTNYNPKELAKSEGLDIQPYMSEYLSHLIENAGEGIVGISKDRTIISWNQHAEKVFGFTKSEAIGKDINIIIPQDRMDTRQPLLERVISNGEVINDLKTEGMRKDGAVVIVVVTISPIRDDFGNIIGASEIFRTLSEEDFTNEDTTHFQKLAALGKLAAEIAHQVNSPLGAISGRIQFLLKNLQKCDNNMLTKSLEQMMDSCNHVEAAIKRLLNYSRKPKSTMEPVDVNTVIDDVLKMTAHRLNLKLIKVHKTLTDDLPKIMGVYDELIHVFVNIISNAIDAMNKGGRLEIVTDIDARSEKLPKSKICVTISDNGHGISEEDIESIFLPFFTTKAEDNGTGLGLSIVEGIVEMHKGNVKVLSKLKHGTSFIFLFPCINNDGR